jgi:hypothetical protein
MTDHTIDAYLVDELGSSRHHIWHKAMVFLFKAVELRPKGQIAHDVVAQVAVPMVYIFRRSPSVFRSFSVAKTIDPDADILNYGWFNGLDSTT